MTKIGQEILLNSSFGIQNARIRRIPKLECLST